MSTIFGIYHRNLQPVPAATFTLMQAAASWWQPDRSGSWRQGPVALGHEMLCNTPESQNEQLPLEQGELVITMDARLDNRRELSELLGQPERPLHQITDSELIVAAYCQWGEECPKHLLGDFAFAIWDQANKKLFCARDHLGVKPFYFHRQDSLFVFGNDLKALLAHPAVSPKLNDEAVANYLVHFLLINKNITFFQEIEKLPAAHSITITPTSVATRCYWRPEDAPTIKLADAEAYARKLLELIESAVHARMRSAYPITAHLSGGLDSSAIAVVAARKLRDKGEQLLAFNWLHAPSQNDDPSHNEWANSAEIANREGIAHDYVDISAEDIIACMRNHNIAHGDSAGFWYEYVVGNAVRKKGSRTILSGWGGDELCSYHGKSYWANMLKNGRLSEVLKMVRRNVAGQKNKTRSALKLFYYNVIIPFIPRRYYHKMPNPQRRQAPPFNFARQGFMAALTEERAKMDAFLPQTKGTIRAHMLGFLQYGHLQGRMESWAATALANRLEYSYPLLDKRIVEFILGVPADFFVNEQTGRHLFRLAADGLIPHKILWKDKESEANRIKKLLEISWAAYRVIFTELKREEVESDYVDLKKLEEVLFDENDEKDLMPVVQATGGALAILCCEKK
ncbi:MAG: asparagine synthase-related protein [Desulfobulbaceae bacterium]|nr:asparagine synthase-related protein [Desulfobulbaceae bacterium]